MDKKKNVIIPVMIITIILSSIMFGFDKNGFPVISFGLLLMFIIYGVWNPPKRHKKFGYHDQQRAMRAFDRSDLLNFELGESSKKKKKKKKIKPAVSYGPLGPRGL